MSAIRCVPALLLPAAFCSASEAPVVRVAYHPNLHGAAVVALGEELGFFEAAGIRVEPYRFLAGPPELQALAAGHIDVGFLGTGALPPVFEGRALLVAIDLLGLADEVLARPGHGVEKLSDLRGKRVITAIGTSGEMILRVALTQAGLTPADVEIQNASPQNAVSAFIAGQADAVALWQPLTNQIRKAVPGVEVLLSGKDLYPKRVFPIVWVANRDFARERPDLLKRFLAAARRAIDYRAQHLDETIDIVSKYADVSKDVLEAQRDSAKFLTSEELDRLIADGRAARWLDETAELFVMMGRLERKPPLKSYAALHFFTEAASEPSDGSPAPPREEGAQVMLPLFLGALAAALGITALAAVRKRMHPPA